MVLGGDGQFGTAHPSPGQAQPLEGLRAGDLVDEVEVDVQEVGLVGVGAAGDDVAVPDLRGKGGGGHRDDLRAVSFGMHSQMMG